MPQLHVVSLSDDGRYLVLADDPAAAAGEFHIALDAHLVAAVRGELPRLSADSAAGPAPVTPREIQARVRAGEAPEQIAAEHALPMAKVERYAGPVLSELERMVDQARLAHVVRARRGASILPLGIAVDGRLAEMRGLRPETVSWTARRAPDGEWFVQVRYQVNGRFCEAGWGYDPAARTLVAHDVASAELGHVDSALAGTPSISAVSVPPGAAADEPPPQEPFDVAAFDTRPDQSATTELEEADWAGADIDPPLPVPSADLIDLPVEWSDGDSAFTSALAWSPDGDGPDLTEPADTSVVSIDTGDPDSTDVPASPMDPAYAEAAPGGARYADDAPGDAADADDALGDAADAEAAPVESADLSAVHDDAVAESPAQMTDTTYPDLTVHVAEAALHADWDPVDLAMEVAPDDGFDAADVEVYTETDTASTVPTQALPTVNVIAAADDVSDDPAEDGVADDLSPAASPPADLGVPLAVADAAAARDMPRAAAPRARKSKPAPEKPVESPGQLKLPVTAKPGARRAAPAPRRSSGRATVPSWSDVLLSTVRAEDRDEAAGE